MTTRRTFLRGATTAGLAALWPGVSHALRANRAGSLLVPMDDRQADHLKAYGLAFRALERGEA